MGYPEFPANEYEFSVRRDFLLDEEKDYQDRGFELNQVGKNDN